MQRARKMGARRVSYARADPAEFPAAWIPLGSHAIKAMSHTPLIV
jgi:hypothetical protein